MRANKVGKQSKNTESLSSGHKYDIIPANTGSNEFVTTFKYKKFIIWPSLTDYW